jgi:hypothetical protein
MDEQKVSRDVFKELHFRLKTWRGMNMLQPNSYALGMHILQKMIRADSLEVITTWQECALEVIMHKGEVIAPPVSGRRYDHLEALSELQTVLGLVSHITSDGMTEALKELDALPPGSKVLPHFTTEPDIDSYLIRPTTPMIFIFRIESGYGVRETWSEFKETGKRTHLPSWLFGQGCLRVDP